jgi:hypothetical protein
MSVPGAPFSSVEDHQMPEEDGTVMTGVRTVGAPGLKQPEQTWEATTREGGEDSRGREQWTASAGARRSPKPRRGLVIAVGALAVLGMIGTLVFALMWAGASSSGVSDPAMVGAARSFLTDLTNFDAKSVDADFSSITAMATGTFSSQATKFFNSSIRSELESALAESRGQIRSLYAQSDNGTSASVYAVVDQVYVNNKISTPQSDVLRILVNLATSGSSWKISDVTVLEGATPASTGTGSGSAGSSVPGQ